MTYGVRTLHPLSFPLPSAWDTAISDWVVWLAASGASPATRGCAGTPALHRRILGVPTPGDVNTAQLIEVIGAEGAASNTGAACAPAWSCSTAGRSPAASSSPIPYRLPKIRAASAHPKRPPTTCGNTYNSTR
ncbi:hypothetical protein I552_9744 [Mycobacterium xenopi 3993]|nr:hypothetical protein I552_9744 [Mycobacterium xenopi 3993]